jgi:AraC-like DNA-binding protein
VRWILRRRIATAQRLLYEGDDSLTEIADHLGFADAFHFSKAFSRLVGLPPSQFRLRSRRGWP